MGATAAGKILVVVLVVVLEDVLLLRAVALVVLAVLAARLLGTAWRQKTGLGAKKAVPRSDERRGAR